MPSLEYVVRPYQTPNAHGAIIIPSTPSSSRERATLTWGAKGTMPPANGGINVTCCNENLTELSRQSSTVRVYQNNDSTSPNYVDWERPDSLKLTKKEKNTCAGDWDQFSGVGAEVSTVLAGFASDVLSGTAAPVSDGTNCSTTWNFKNQSQ